MLGVLCTANSGTMNIRKANQPSRPAARRRVSGNVRHEMKMIIAICLAAILGGCASERACTLGPFRPDSRIPDVKIASVNLREVTLTEGVAWMTKQTGVPIVLELPPTGNAKDYDYRTDQRFTLKTETISLSDMIAILCAICALAYDVENDPVILRLRPINR